MATVKEGDLDRLFAEKMRDSGDFSCWVLSKTCFARFASSSRLLVEEQIAARPKVDPENWYRHWWCRVPDGSESETDVFAVFESVEPRLGFALHIENKPPGGHFTPNQQLNYRVRGQYMAKKNRYLDYSEFETILIVPWLEAVSTGLSPTSRYQTGLRSSVTFWS